MNEVYEIGKQLVEFCRKRDHIGAIEALYSPEIVSIEAMSGPEIPARSEGVESIRAKNQWWIDNHDIHRAEAEGPYPHGDRFVVRFIYDVTPKAGPQAGNRYTMEEAALYTVKDGKITQEEFFYHMG